MRSQTIKHTFQTKIDATQNTPATINASCLMSDSCETVPPAVSKATPCNIRMWLILEGIYFSSYTLPVFSVCQ